ncbi:hypothetical protein [Desulfobacterium sp. N47]|uniref:Uncharacterized protein n=1 Tax=uncultured Desulfobacterium sp. TaxID=201089 RepID=E1YC11_9BACT|nr:unknown protein [uncultured Desulfobacterium sp.]CBX30574.1 unknown protein [uncultured Desulfobacterium sp.]
MLSFTERLKELIFDVERTGGSPVQKLSPSPDLVLQLKGYAIKRLREEPGSLPRNVEFFLLEEFNEGFFEEGIRVSLVHLGEMGISDPEDVLTILRTVIDKRLNGILRKSSSQQRPYHDDTISIDDAIVQSVNYVWDEYGSEPTILYNFAKERFLILWDYHRNKWQTTGLGRFLLELKPLQAVPFLLTIDLTFNTGEQDTRHISANALISLLQTGDRYERVVIPLHREMLKRLGVIRTLSRRHWEYELTPLGKVVVESVVDDSNPMNEIVAALVQNEEQGIQFEGSEKELRELESQITSEAIESTGRRSIENAIDLYRKGSYVDAARVFFPSIESISSQMLSIAGEDVSNHKKFPGLASKVARLEELKLIPADLSKGIEIAVSRNKVLHGEYEPLEQEYAYPLCVAAIIYLRRMLVEFAKSRTKETPRDSG